MIPQVAIDLRAGAAGPNPGPNLGSSLGPSVGASNAFGAPALTSSAASSSAFGAASADVASAARAAEDAQPPSASANGAVVGSSAPLEIDLTAEPPAEAAPAPAAPPATAAPAAPAAPPAARGAAAGGRGAKRARLLAPKRADGTIQAAFAAAPPPAPPKPTRVTLLDPAPVPSRPIVAELPNLEGGTEFGDDAGMTVLEACCEAINPAEGAGSALGGNLEPRSPSKSARSPRLGPCTLKCSRRGEVLWQATLASPPTLLGGNSAYSAAACADSSLHLFSAAGRRLAPPLHATAPPAALHVSGGALLLVGSDGTVVVYADLPHAPRCAMRASAAPLLSGEATRGGDVTRGDGVVKVHSALLIDSPDESGDVTRGGEGSGGASPSAHTPLLVLSSGAYVYQPQLQARDAMR